MAVLRVGALPAAPLDAAAAYYSQYLERARELTRANEAVAVVFEPAGPEHRAWRLAAVQELAREATPHRVNAIAGADDGAIDEALAYLATAPGVTGQLLALMAIAPNWAKAGK